MHLEAQKHDNTIIHNNENQVSVQKYSTINLINDGSYPNKYTDIMTKDMSNRTSINNNT